MTEKNYIEINRQLWNHRTDIHMKSDFYDVTGFLKGHTSLKEIELKLLGDVKGKTILHLQCHFGQDTISLARMGALVTGVDLSDKAIERAVELAEKTKSDATFICCDVYDLPNHLDKKFDMVFTSYGTIGWLPDMNKWAKLIAAYLKPGGRLVFVDFHPVVWMFDDKFEKVAYSYLNTGPIIETETSTYADRGAVVNMEYVGWNHGVGEVVTNLLNHQMEITSLEEYDYSPYACFNCVEEYAPERYRIKHMENKLPLVYSITAVRKG